MARPVAIGSDAALDAEVLDRLYRRYRGLVRRRVRRFYSEQEASDVVSEVFERVARTGHTFTGQAAWSTWLYRTTTHHCINRIRDARRRRELLGTDATPLWQSSDPTCAAESKLLLTQLWKALDPDLVAVAVYYYVDGMTQSDIGELLGVSDRTISTRLTQFRAAARRATGDEA